MRLEFVSRFRDSDFGLLFPCGFDFTHHVGRVCADMAAQVDELRHIDMSRVAVSFRQTRKRMPHGLYASLTPLRFAGGQTHSIRRGRKFSIQRVEVDGREMLYVLNFYLPRFLDLGFREKLTTIAHELLHIGPQFDGDLRRFSGRCYAHSHSHAAIRRPGRAVGPALACPRAGAIALRVPAPGLPAFAGLARRDLRPADRRAETAAGRMKG